MSFWNDVAHTPSKTNGIRCDNALVLAVIGERHHSIIVFSFVKLEGTKIHPSATSHLLVHLELRRASFVMNGIGGIIHRVLVRLVRHIDRIFTLLGNIGNPLCDSLILVR